MKYFFFFRLKTLKGDTATSGSIVKANNSDWFVNTQQAHFACTPDSSDNGK
jgi:hypothetical protein